MRKKLIENAAFEVAAQVRAVEASIAAALAEMAELQAKMLRAESVSGIGVSRSQTAYVEMARTLEGLIAARGGMAACHASLAEARQFVPGLRTVAFGDAEECPPPSAVADLRIVA